MTDRRFVVTGDEYPAEAENPIYTVRKRDGVTPDSYNVMKGDLIVREGLSKEIADKTAEQYNKYGAGSLPDAD